MQDTEFTLKEQEARQFYRLLNHGEDYTRVRCQDVQAEKGKDDYVRGEDEFVRWARSACGKGNLFVGRNPVDGNGKVLRATGFSLDIDPVRPKKTASSPDQHSNALRWGQRVLERLGDGYLLSSGNGALVYCPFDEPVTEGLDEFKDKCRQFEKDIRSFLTDGTVVLDATYDLARLVKVAGSISTKGDRQLWRYAGFRHFPGRGYDKSAVRRAIQATGVSKSVLAAGVLHDVPRLPPVEGLKQYGKGESVGRFEDRSDADYALAIRLKEEGFGPDRILAELGRIGFRPERGDDHRRIVEKLFAQPGTGTPLSGLCPKELRGVSAAPSLWTPAEGGLDVLRGRANDAGACSTGFRWLDSKLNGGYRPGVLYAVEAPTNGGKSTYIVQAANALCRAGRRVLLVITEMDVKEAALRLAACETGIPGAQIQSGQLSGQDKERLAAFECAFRTYQLFVHYTVSPNQSVIEQLIDDTKPDVLLWDYFQHFETGLEARQTQLASLARWYESLALQKEIAVVVAAQLHSQLDFKTHKVQPSSMHQIKDCKVLNDTAKVVITLNWAGEALSEDGPQAVRLNIEKNKGAMSSSVMTLERNIPRFRE